jgi:hypothetical protein
MLDLRSSVRLAVATPVVTKKRYLLKQCRHYCEIFIPRVPSVTTLPPHLLLAVKIMQDRTQRGCVSSGKFSIVPLQERVRSDEDEFRNKTNTKPVSELRPSPIIARHSKLANDENRSPRVTAELFGNR